MRKNRLFIVSHLFVFCIGLSLCKGEKTFEVLDGCYVPLFKTTSGLNLSYEAGAHGTNCYDLITVLLPGTFVNVHEFGEKITEVVWHVNDKKTYKGLMHNEFLQNFCKEVPEDDVKWLPKPMPLREIRETFQWCSDKENNVPYCWGGCCFGAVPLPGDYTFSQVFSEDEKEGKNGKTCIKRPYELRGFDCSGWLHFISGGLLEHSTRRLREYDGGKVLWKIGKNETVSFEDLKKKLPELKLQDTDYIVIIGHVVVWHDGGLLEFRGKDYGCVYTKGEEAVAKRLMELIARSRERPEEDSDVRFIRWHPELFKDEK